MNKPTTKRGKEMALFLHAIAADPADETSRLVFADWLEEHGDGRAEFLRLDCTLAAKTTSAEDKTLLKPRWDELWTRLSDSWQAVLGRPPIENCRAAIDSAISAEAEPRFAFECPLKWENLKATDQETVRSCDSCKKLVHYCHSVGEARKLAVQGECVAVNIGVRRYPGDLSWPTVSTVRMGLFLPPKNHK